MKKKEWKEEYLKAVKESWWYETLATEDPEFTEEIVNLLGTQSLRERSGGLPVGTKHLIWLVVECAAKWEPATIKRHMVTALDNGYTPQQILEAMEVAVPPTGYPSFIHGFRVWKEVVKERTK
jgi:4-carboxymuconolactone decarboxylase